MPNEVYLIKVEANANNNKYYKMIPNGDIFRAEYGRVGANCQVRSYSMHKWNSKYNEKIKKGYIDQTNLMIEDNKPKSEYKEIDNSSIAEIVERLQKLARQTIKDNYTISSENVTQNMVDEAQTILTALKTITHTNNSKDIDKINDWLIKMFTTIPRKMGRVSDYLLQSFNNFEQILEREQDLLDVMRGQVKQHSIVAETNEELSDKTILEVMGLIIEEVTEKDIKIIKQSLGEIKDRFSKAWIVKNVETQEKFDGFIKDNKIKNKKLLWHGSRNENWWSIINSGLVLRPNAVITGKLYGHGIYFAPKSKKSLGYSSLNGSYWAKGGSTFGLMALYDVAYGMAYDVYDFDSKYYDLNYSNLQKFKQGANCLHAHAGANLGHSSLRNDEIVVYNESQCTIQYLVELK